MAAPPHAIVTPPCGGRCGGRCAAGPEVRAALCDLTSAYYLSVFFVSLCLPFLAPVSLPLASPLPLLPALRTALPLLPPLGLFYAL